MTTMIYLPDKRCGSGHSMRPVWFFGQILRWTCDTCTPVEPRVWKYPPAILLALLLTGCATASAAPACEPAAWLTETRIDGEWVTVTVRLSNHGDYRVEGWRRVRLYREECFR